MMLTCEAGGYNREEAIGFRLENDDLLTEDGNINLTEVLPIEIDDVKWLIDK